jgi:hypothetical protein
MLKQLLKAGKPHLSALLSLAIIHKMSKIEVAFFVPLVYNIAQPEILFHIKISNLQSRGNEKRKWTRMYA